MWKAIACYLSGRHEYGISCGSGAVYLQCAHCGKRSNGWEIEAKPNAGPARRAVAKPGGKAPSRVLPFDRAVAN